MKFVRGLLVSFTLFLLVSLVLGMAKTDHADAADFLGANFYPSGGCGNGAGCSPSYWYFTFTTATDIPIDGKFVVTFPAEFNVASAAVQYWSGIDGTRTVSVNGQEVTVTRNGDGSISTPGYKWFRLTGIVNPDSAGTYELSLKTTDSSDVLIDGVATTDEVIQEIKSIYTFPGTLMVGSTTNYRIKFFHSHNIPIDGKIKITFPAGFDVSGATFDSWSDIDGGQTTAIDGQTITLTRDSAGTIQSFGTETINFTGIVNPSSTTDVVLTLGTYTNGDVSIDGSVDSTNYVTVNSNVDVDPSSWHTKAGDNRGSSSKEVNGPEYGTLVKAISLDAQPYDLLLGKNNEDIVLMNTDATVRRYGTDGSLEWQFKIPDWTDRVCNGALDYDENLYITTCGNARYRVYGIDKDGNQLWGLSTEGDDYGGYTGVRLWGGSGGYMMHKTHGGYTETRPLSTGVRIGNYADVVWGGFNTRSVMYEDTFFTHYNSAIQLKAVKLDGTVVWQNNTDYDYNLIQNQMALSVDGSVLYQGSRSGKMYAVDTSDGSKKWEYVGDELRVQPALSDDGVLYFGDINGKIVALKDNGDDYSELWTHTSAGGYVYWYGAGFTLAKGNDMLYTLSASTDEGVQALDAIAGIEKWKYKGVVAAPGNYSVVPIDSNGKIHTITSASGEYHVLHFDNWTISGDVESEYAKVGDSISIIATTNMLDEDPITTEANKVQVIMPNSDIVPLEYDSEDFGTTTWVGEWVIPSGTEDGSYSAILEASANQVETNVETHFETPPEGSNNTGILGSFSYATDSTGPTGSIEINNGDDVTNNSEVVLTLLASDGAAGVNQMKVGLEDDLSDADWEVYSTSKSVELGSVEGNRTVYVQFSDNVGNQSEIYSDDIELDETGPVLTPEYINTLKIASDITDYYWTSGKLVITGVTESLANVSITVESDPVTCDTKADGSGSFTCEFTELIPDGYHSITIISTDAAGNSTSYQKLTLGVRVGLAQTGDPILCLFLLGILLVIGVYSPANIVRRHLSSKAE